MENIAHKPFFTSIIWRISTCILHKKEGKMASDEKGKIGGIGYYIMMKDYKNKPLLKQPPQWIMHNNGH